MLFYAHNAQDYARCQSAPGDISTAAQHIHTAQLRGVNYDCFCKT